MRRGVGQGGFHTFRERGTGKLLLPIFTQNYLGEKSYLRVGGKEVDFYMGGTKTRSGVRSKVEEPG